MTQRYSAEVPWVLVGLVPGGFEVYCEVCSSGGLQVSKQGIADFASAHSAHQAPRGSLRLGDAVAAVAKPVARAMGLDQSCTPCEARRRMLNSVRRPW